MKTLLRATLLAAALLVTALTAAKGDDPPGTCYTTCFSNTGFSSTEVQWTTTEDECCGGVINPCPTGYHATENSYQPYLGYRGFCPPML